MCFAAKNEASLCMDGEAIVEVDKSKLLDVIIDDNLSWKYHISFMGRKVARDVWVIIKARKCCVENLWNVYITHSL